MRNPLYTIDLVILENVFKYNEDIYTIPKSMLSILNEGKEVEKEEAKEQEINVSKPKLTVIIPSQCKEYS